MLIGVISDTHGLLGPEALNALASVEHIIHAGDIGSPDIVPRLEEIAPVTAIRGNVDTQASARELPTRQVVTLAGRTIYIIHDLGDLDIDPVAAGFDMVVAGHSHMPKIETSQGVVYVNPGRLVRGGSGCQSPSPQWTSRSRRFDQLSARSSSEGVGPWVLRLVPGDATRRMRHSVRFPLTRVRACARKEERDDLSRASHLHMGRTRKVNLWI